MFQSTLKKALFFAALFLTGILLMQFVWRIAATNQPEARFSPEKVNLALRRTAHHLLSAAGDSVSRIPAVQQTGENSWLIRLERAFDYDTLPTLLHASFELHKIRGNYDVAVLRCADGALQLGYNFLDFSKNKEVPCGGRGLVADCYNLQVTFPEIGKKKNALPATGGLVLLGGLLAAAFYALGRKTRPAASAKSAENVPEKQVDLLHFGNSRLDIANQMLHCGSAHRQLTYRETKLLHLFAGRPNQLLERGFILENVWADEGILVGRSVDVFVSRLRKMLRDDPSVGIAAVHGVGYRLEVR
jgi:Transcriptional regulatory protein, C terminal